MNDISYFEMDILVMLAFGIHCEIFIMANDYFYELTHLFRLRNVYVHRVSKLYGKIYA